MKIKILKDVAVKGQHCSVGSVVETSQTDGEYLVGMGKAEITKDSVKNLEPTENRAKGLKKAVKKIFKK
tara:strand:- start:2663 stop:2869 length:207 start_codon:yes stop_codon:yes gene_type:complete